MAGDPQDKFLTGSTFGHVAYMTLTSALGITFIFIVASPIYFGFRSWVIHKC
jgi:hypothetical protein